MLAVVVREVASSFAVVLRAALVPSEQLMQETEPKWSPAEDACNEIVAALFEPSTFTFGTLMLSCPVTLYVPAGNNSVSPDWRAAIALLIAAVSSVVPLPVAPNV